MTVILHYDKPTELTKKLEELADYAFKLDPNDSTPHRVHRDGLNLWDGMLNILPHEDYPDILTYEGWPGADIVMKGRVMEHEYTYLKHIIKAAFDINEEVNNEETKG